MSYFILSICSFLLHLLLSYIQRYNHFELQSACSLFRDEDYLPPQPEQEDKEATDLANDVRQIVKVTVLENLLESVCPRCGLVSFLIHNMGVQSMTV